MICKEKYPSLEKALEDLPSVNKELQDINDQI